MKRDPHSFSNPDEVMVRHLALDLTVDFETKTLKGFAELTVDNIAGATQLVVDTRDLLIASVEANGKVTSFELDTAAIPVFGQSLTISISPGTKKVKIYYATQPQAAALQWLSPAQTNGGTKPFLFTQSQAILARTWIPLQDSPGVKFTYDAVIRTQPGYLALMSAENPQEKNSTGVYTFHMPQPVSSYLMALTVGDLAFQPLGDICGVYAEPAMLQRSAYEFADLQKMIDAAGELYGKYQWGRYDVVVLPPSFPFGGMENPRLTFATPTIIAGDRSLVSLIAHELAHSWSGNLVTNATWNDFWLNEGFTVYFEQRIMEKLYGAEYTEMLTALALGELKRTIAEMGPDNPDTRLLLDLEGRDPDEGVSDIAYEKGRFFLLTIEQAVGRPRWDAFLNAYFDTFAFKSTTTEMFLDFLDRQLIKGDTALANKIGIDRWINGTGLPSNCPEIRSAAFARVEEVVNRFRKDPVPALKDSTTGWTTHHWLHFLRELSPGITLKQMELLDQWFAFSKSKNAEIQCDWYLLAIKTDYRPAFPGMQEFLTGVGRRKFLKPIYGELAKTPAHRKWATEVYADARKGYHFVTIQTIDEILDIH